MPEAPSLRGVPLPSSLLLRREPTFAIHDENGLPLDLHENFDSGVDPIVYVNQRDAIALLKWGEQHGKAIVRDETIPIIDRQLFVHRGLLLEASRLYQHRARFARLDALTEALQVAATFLTTTPPTYAAALVMRSPTYSPVVHAVGTALLPAALYSGVLAHDGDAVSPTALASALLAGMSADLGLVNSHRDLLSFDRTMTPPERNILRAHPMSSERILRHIAVEQQEVLDAVGYHHERADGSGYPLGLDSSAVPRLARCVGLADTFLGLITDRPGRPGITPGAAIGAVANGEFTRDVVTTLAQLVAGAERATPVAVPA